MSASVGSGTRSAPGEPRQTSCDAIVIGGGISGLTAGALLAKAGRAVLVVEAADRPGGHARAFQDDGYTFDPAVHLIMGCGEDGLIDAVLRHLDVRERCEFVSVDPFYTTQFPGLELALPAGHEPYIEAHARAFPAEAEGFRRLADLCTQIHAEFLAFPSEPRRLDLLSTPRRFPALFRYRNATLRDVRDRELTDPRARAVYATLWPYIGLPSGRMSFLDWGVMMASYVDEGAFYCRGSFQVLADALAEALAKHGGELLLGRRVTGIRTERGRVRGVELAGGAEIASPLVLSAIDPRETFGVLLEPSDSPRRYRKKLAGLKPSISTLGLQLATDLDIAALGVAQENIISATWNPELHERQLVEGQIPSIAVTIPTVSDPTVAPSGESVVSFMGFVPAEIELNAQRREEYARQLLAYGERLLPGLGQHITRIARRSATSEEEFPLRRIDAIYGWEVTPAQAGQQRLAQETPIDGLRLVGQWTRPAHGVWTVVLSAIQAARAILGETRPTGPAPFDLP